MDMAFVSKGQGHNSDISIPIKGAPLSIAFPPLFTRDQLYKTFLTQVLP